MPSAIFVERIEDPPEQVVALARRELAEVSHEHLAQQRLEGQMSRS
jgi:hypothetical protein